MPACTFCNVRGTGLDSMPPSLSRYALKWLPWLAALRGFCGIKGSLRKPGIFSESHERHSLLNEF